MNFNSQQWLGCVDDTQRMGTVNEDLSFGVKLQLGLQYMNFFSTTK